MSNVILLSLISFLCCFLPMSNQASGASLAARTAAAGQLEPAARTPSTSSSGQAESKEGQKNETLSPEQTVDRLAAKSSNWQEPSQHSEEKYKKAILQWLDAMQPQQREQAHRILRDAHQDMHALRTAIRDKKRELANMSFNRHTTPEALPRLGQELHKLRQQLRSRLELVSQRLRQEAGVSMGPLEGDAFWLQPQDIDPGKPKASNKGRQIDKVNSTNSQTPMFSMKH